MEESNHHENGDTDIITDSQKIVQPLDDNTTIRITEADSRNETQQTAMTNNNETPTVVSTDLQISIVVTNTSEVLNTQSVSSTEVQVDEFTNQLQGSTQPNNVQLLLSSEPTSIDLIDGPVQNTNEIIHPQPDPIVIENQQNIAQPTTEVGSIDLLGEHDKGPEVLIIASSIANDVPTNDQNVLPPPNVSSPSPLEATTTVEKVKEDENGGNMNGFIVPKTTSVAIDETNDLPSAFETAKDEMGMNGENLLNGVVVPLTNPLDVTKNVEKTFSNTNPAKGSSIVSHEGLTGESMTANIDNEQRILFLESELEKALATIDLLESDNAQKANDENDKSSLLLELQMELQNKLQIETSNRITSDERAANAEKKIMELEKINKAQTAEIQQLSTLQVTLNKEREAKILSDKNNGQLEIRVRELERETNRQKFEIQEYEKQLLKIRERVAIKEKDMVQLRTECNEHERFQMVATSRLDTARKNEMEKVQLAGKYEDLMISALLERDQAKEELLHIKKRKLIVEQELEKVKEHSQIQIKKIESLLEKEKQLNEERRTKMKLFVDHKAEEIRQVKEEMDSIQLELGQTNKSLIDLNNRHTQLHTQWVQVQSRNRELQRDVNRMKKDSENLHKVGDTLEMKLSRSTNETEEHKNKRLAAKHELMTVLKALDMERQMCNKLKDSIKFKFTPRTLQQQQTLTEGVNELERQLLTLSTRLGKQSIQNPQQSDTEHNNNNNNNQTFEFQSTSTGLYNSQAESETAFLIAKLEYDTQKVENSIDSMMNGIRTLRQMVDDSNQRNCYSVFSEMIHAASVGRNQPLIATHDEMQSSASRNATTSSSSSTSLPSRIGFPPKNNNNNNHRYGHISENDH